jgi:phage protein D
MTTRDYYAPDFEVKIEGLTMQADVTAAVIDLAYESSLDTADMFTLRLNNAGLRFSDSALFDVGKNVEIYMGYAGDLQPMMLGEIAAVSPEFPESGAATLTVTGYDKSYRMRHNRKFRTFSNSIPSLVAAQIAAENLLIPMVDPASMPFESMTQHSSDMEFLQELADSTFFDVYVYWDRLYFQLPRPQTEAVALEWGRNLSSFSPRLSTSGLAGAVAILDYDSDLAQPIIGLVPAIAADFDLETIDERLGSAFRDLLTSLGTHYLADRSVNSFPDALSLGKAVVSAILEGLFEGYGTCIGIPDLRAGRIVEIGGVGRRFSGRYRLRRVTHTIGEGGYRTSFEVSQRNSGTILQLMRRWVGPNDGHMPGSLVGTVLSNVDPLLKNRVLITYPALGGEVMNWAKVDPPDAGMQFMPNVGDDVVVTFEKGDLDRPRIVARSWNVKKGPPEMPAPTNLRRVIQSPAGHTITLDDTPGTGSISLETALGAKVTLTDGPGAGRISLETLNVPQKGAKIVLDDTPGAENIVIESSIMGTRIAVNGAGNITIETAGTVSINKGVQGAARQGDKVNVTIPPGTFLVAATAGVLNPTLMTVEGVITSASQTVRIGG